MTRVRKRLIFPLTISCATKVDLAACAVMLPDTRSQDSGGRLREALLLGVCGASDPDAQVLRVAAHALAEGSAARTLVAWAGCERVPSRRLVAVEVLFYFLSLLHPHEN